MPTANADPSARDRRSADAPPADAVTDPLTFVDETRGLPPGTWGPCTWAALHYIALAYPETPTETCQGDYRTFLHALARVLPCAKCREGLKAHLRDEPPGAALASGRDALFRWTVDLHNAVNEKNGAQRYDPAAARKLYDAGLGCRTSARSLRWMRAAVGAAAVLALAAVAAMAYMSPPPTGVLRRWFPSGSRV